MSIDWVFFDMGGVLVDDEQAMLMFYRKLYERCEKLGCPRSYDEIFKLREKLIKEGDGIHWHTAGKTLLGENGWRELYEDLIAELRLHYHEYNLPFPGVSEMLTETASRFRMGLAANQLSECRELLEHHNWMGHFEVLGISEEVGLRKPDPEFFKWLLDEAGVEPGRCLMIGDRIDNDITPAKRLGFRTLWFQMKPDYDRLCDGDDFARAYVASHKRAATKFSGPADESQEPDFTAGSPGEVQQALNRIAIRGSLM